MIKNFVLDANVLIENYNAIDILKNGQDGKDENRIFIPKTVIHEIDKLKKDPKLRPIIIKVIQELNKHKESIIMLGDDKPLSNDDLILDEMTNDDDLPGAPILVTNDKMLQFKATQRGYQVQEFRESLPFESESQTYTGFIEEGENYIPNCFYWKEGILCYNSNNGEKKITYMNEPWKVEPRNMYQNAAIELMMDDNVPLVSIQSDAGYGKTFLSLATALHTVLQLKRYRKIYIFKSAIELGPKIGYLPGDMSEKMEPYINYIHQLLFKLHELRDGNKNLFFEKNKINNKIIEILPLTYIRGMNIEDAFVIVDETQNISRVELRTLLTRMCENVKCICVGDTRQVDNIHLNEQNNGLNWMVRMFKGQSEYGHIVLKGSKSRGPITDMALKTGL